MLQDPAEMDELPKSGIAILRDVETGAGQFVWMRAGLQKQMEEIRAQHINNVEEASRSMEANHLLLKVHLIRRF